MKLDANVTIFTVSPLADPARGGRWGCVQIWRDMGTPQVTELCEMKWRVVTAEGRDPQPECDEVIRALLAFVRENEWAGIDRRDVIVLDTVRTDEVP